MLWTNHNRLITSLKIPGRLKTPYSLSMQVIYTLVLLVYYILQANHVINCMVDHLVMMSQIVLITLEDLHEIQS